MRSRSNSGVKLDNYARVVQQTILQHQVSVNKCFHVGCAANKWRHAVKWGHLVYKVRAELSFLQTVRGMGEVWKHASEVKGHFATLWCSLTLCVCVCVCAFVEETKVMRSMYVSQLDADVTLWFDTKSLEALGFVGHQPLCASSGGLLQHLVMDFSGNTKHLQTSAMDFANANRLLKVLINTCPVFYFLSYDYIQINNLP